MSENWNSKLKKLIQSEVESMNLEGDAQKQILADIHNQLNERSKFMKFSKRKMMVIIVASAMMLGGVTAMASGKIAGWASHSDRNEDILTIGELEKAASDRLEANLVIPENLMDGSAFANGQINEIQGLDEKQNVMVTYPEVYAMYGEEGDGSITLSISKSTMQIPEGTASYDSEEVYGGINLQAKTDQYLFLPLNAEPSEADKSLAAEGKLFIGTGSSEEERKVLKSVFWIKDGLEYKLFTYSNKSLEDMVTLAKGIIDGK